VSLYWQRIDIGRRLTESASATGFDVAKRLLRSPEVKGNLKPPVIEQVVLSSSREFYENAATGNMHTGEMRLAYEW
jgi:hypothetical protein